MSMRPYNPDEDAADRWLTLLRTGSIPERIRAREHLAEIFEQRGMFEEAIDLLTSNIRAGVQNADIYRWMARLYRQQGDEATAMQAAAEAAKYLSPPRLPINDQTTVLPAQQFGTAYHPPPMTQPFVHSASAPAPSWQSPRAETPRGGGGSRIAAMVLGVVGGIFGILAALFALSLGGIGGAFGMQGADLIKTLGFSAMGFCLLGFFGSALAMPKPTAAGVILLIAAGGFLLSVSWFAIVTTPLFILAAVLAFMGRR